MLTNVLSIHSHPFDKFADRTDAEMRSFIESVGSDRENHMTIMNRLVFDDRVEGLSDSCIELMKSLIHPDPNKRMTSENMRRHPWIQGLTASWSAMENTQNELKAYWQGKFRSEILKKFAASLGISASSGEKTLADKDVEEMFRTLDTKKNGVLDLEEIQAAFRDFGLSDNHVRTIFACADLDGTGVIHLDEFQALLSHKGNSEGGPLHVGYLQKRFKSHILNKFLGAEDKNATVLDKDKLREIFNEIDLEGNGVLDPHDIRVVLRSAGEQEEVITRIVASLDVKQNGRVSWEDFLVIMGVEEDL